VTQPTNSLPAGTYELDGVIHHPSPLSVPETVDALKRVIDAAGAKVFAEIDQDGEASSVGLQLRETKLLVFGSPKGGTPVMQAAPLAALDLPLKILVWADDAGKVWTTHLSGEWLVGRYELAGEALAPLSAADRLTAAVAQG
jgi:uncharacterized protein (DUF302 family)